MNEPAILLDGKSKKIDIREIIIFDSLMFPP